MSINHEPKIRIEDDIAIVSCAHGEEVYLRSGSDIAHFTYQSAMNNLRVKVEPIQVLTSWECWQADGIRRVEEHRLLLALGRLQPGLQVLGYPKSYNDSVRMELWSDKNPQRWTDFIRMSQAYADSGYDQNWLSTTTARLHYRLSDGAERADWGLTVLIPDAAFTRIEENTNNSTLESISLSLKIGQTYVLDSKDFFGQRQVGSTFRERSAFFMLRNADNTSAEFSGELTDVSLLSKRASEHDEDL